MVHELPDAAVTRRLLGALVIAPPVDAEGAWAGAVGRLAGETVG